MFALARVDANGCSGAPFLCLAFGLGVRMRSVVGARVVFGSYRSLAARRGPAI